MAGREAYNDEIIDDVIHKRSKLNLADAMKNMPPI